MQTPAVTQDLSDYVRPSEPACKSCCSICREWNSVSSPGGGGGGGAIGGGGVWLCMGLNGKSLYEFHRAPYDLRLDDLL